jgi:hypothetical protein
MDLGMSRIEWLSDGWLAAISDSLVNWGAFCSGLPGIFFGELLVPRHEHKTGGGKAAT